MSKESRKPDLVLKAYDRISQIGSRKLGVGWLNEDGSVSIKLDVGVGIQYNSQVNYTLFPIEDKFEE